MGEEAAEDGRPEGRIEPSIERVREVRERLAEQDFAGALETIETMEAEGGLEADWLGFYRGLALLGTRDLDDAFKAFQATYKRIVSARSDELGADRFRVAAKCLKKMGWYHRRGRGYGRAYACHSMEYDLLEAHGSNLEVHDAALSLDVVSYNLRSPQISKIWLERSVEAAQGIEDETFRVKALGLSWNNLAGTLCDIGMYGDAVEAAETSLENWERYEELEDGEENRVVWAKHIIGDAYKRWGDQLSESDEGEAAREKLAAARDTLAEAVEEAEERGMSEEDLGDIRGKFEDVRAAIEAVEDESDDGGEQGEETLGEETVSSDPAEDDVNDDEDES